MDEPRQDRLFAGCGIVSVVLNLVGASISSSAGSAISLTIASTPAQIADAVAKPAGALVWVGAYLQLVSYGAFLAFAVWAAAKLGGGMLGQLVRVAATSYATLSIASLCVLDAIEYRAGHGIDLQLASALHAVNEALFVAAWSLSALFLLAAGSLALIGGRRRLGGWSAIGIGLITLVSIALSMQIEGPGIVSYMLSFAWIVYANITLSRRASQRPA
jgi:hypothetical protein